MQILLLGLLSPVLHFLAESAAVWRLKFRAKCVEGISMSKAAFLHSSIQRICPNSVLSILCISVGVRVEVVCFSHAAKYTC